MGGREVGRGGGKHKVNKLEGHANKSSRLGGKWVRGRYSFN